MQILDVKQPLKLEDVENRYKHLFEINDKNKGGTLYLQSKVFLNKNFFIAILLPVLISLLHFF